MSMEDGLRAEHPRLAPSGAPRPAAGIVHLGLGAFYRAHGARYIADAVAASGGDWGIVGVSLQRPDQRDRLAPQGFAYTAVEMAPQGLRLRLIEIVRDVLVAPEDPEAVVAAMADPAVRLVTLTVTEKGYCHVPSIGRLDRNHPQIQRELAGLARPATAPGFLVAALARRHMNGAGPLTIMSCDNLPENGVTLRNVVLDFAGLVDSRLADWIAEQCAFPSTMVDCIVPATTAADIETVAELTGRHDASPVMHEPYREWVIESRFAGPMPDLAAVGAKLVGDVRPHELMKLRCLNGSHSALAYLGYLDGRETIGETVAVPAFRAYVQRLWRNEIVPTFAPPAGADPHAYCAALLERYANPAIRHRTWQIAMDGSQKLPQRLLGTLADRLSVGLSSPCIILALAGWMRYVGGVDEKGAPIDVRDPLAARLKAAFDSCDHAEGRVEAFLAMKEIFPESLAGNPELRRDLTAALDGLCRTGAGAMVRSLASA
jgi:fructuronate reductase